MVFEQLLTARSPSLVPPRARKTSRAPRMYPIKLDDAVPPSKTHLNMMVDPSLSLESANERSIKTLKLADLGSLPLPIPPSQSTANRKMSVLGPSREGNKSNSEYASETKAAEDDAVPQ